MVLLYHTFDSSAGYAVLARKLCCFRKWKALLWFLPSGVDVQMISLHPSKNVFSCCKFIGLVPYLLSFLQFLMSLGLSLFSSTTLSSLSVCKYVSFSSRKFSLNYFFLLFTATSSAYESSGVKGWIGAVAAGLHHSHSNEGSELGLWPIVQLLAVLNPLTHWARLGIEPNFHGY